MWIQRINAAARLEGMSYSKLMGALHKAGIEINRKVLADLAMNHPEAFKAIVAKAKLLNSSVNGDIKKIYEKSNLTRLLFFFIGMDALMFH